MGLADFGFGVGVMGGRDGAVFGPRIDTGGDAVGAPPGRGFLTMSPLGNGFLAGLATILSLTTEGLAFAGPDGREVRPFTP